MRLPGMPDLDSKSQGSKADTALRRCPSGMRLTISGPRYLATMLLHLPRSD